ncbi:hypothetical protein METBIDRAFT_40341 [Metschnikowia bicuspidata var. bicuspidata NRRL YB-4993]|uniref:Alpha box domain-containing protein n=1 Tax=Metschnikowia bicuspidata var. bicuspidata NRRL YB-4993 TaxID=869754 RepID=A0A1A0HDY3_9ASCO|nr:hypothetical protein METBIDRAFT_40341 [Metschnikowia bicuspidata var. bicuspidata NRRL YB-4993]OBA22190.1 hypothetical protein METBIDRAFT_40341 [Metschnikowia bicuspidata var. bicuspidata NRRL YB-4993]
MEKSPFCDPNLASQKATYSVLQSRALPQIPIPSSSLQDLLCKYLFNEVDTNKKLSRIKQGTRYNDTKKRRINGFIAFRSFYSKTIKGTSHQKELSSKLAAIWKTEPNHQTWNSYALQYNATGGNESFVSWLNRKLGFDTNIEAKKTFKSYKNLTLKNVEDVFFEDINYDLNGQTSN